MSQSEDPMEQLFLKSEFGGELDKAETARVAGFLGTDQGRAFRDGVRQTREILQVRVADADDRTPLAPARVAELRARFDATHRLNTRSMSRRFLGLLLGSFCMATLGALVGHILVPFHPRAPESPDLTNLWIVLYSAAAIFSAYMFYRLRELEHAPDLFDRLARREPSLPRSLADHLGYFPIIAVLVMLTATREGWLWALAEVLTLWLVFALSAHYLRRLLRRQRMDTDPELWTWWYGERDQGRS